MRIGLNARFMVDPSRRGFNRYTYSLAKALTDISGVEVWLISMDPVHDEFLRDLPARVRVAGAIKPTWWEQVVLPRTIKTLNLDVFHAPATMGLPLRRACPYVLTIHDVVARAAQDLVDLGSVRTRLYRRVFQTVSLSAASRIIAVSEHTKSELCQHYGVPADRVKVIHEGADKQFHVIPDLDAIDEALRRYHIHAPYVLYAGGFDRRKNVGALIRAYARSKVRTDSSLVLVGAKTGEYPLLKAQAEGSAPQARIQFVGYVPDRDLALLYNGASLFVYPSLYEGFGLPVVEAMACGVPVLTSDRTSLPEVTDGAAILFDPTHSENIASTLDRVYGDKTLLQCSRERGLAVAAGLTWTKAAKQTLDVYRSVVGVN